MYLIDFFQNNDYQTRIAEMNDHTKLIEKQLAEVGGT